MANFNYVKLLFYVWTAAMVALGTLLNFYEKYLPSLMSQSLRYGKVAIKDVRGKFKLLEVPKSWFNHFYIWAGTFSTISTLLMVDVLAFGHPLPQWFASILDCLIGSNRRSSVSASSSLLAIILFSLHCWRRCYETSFISVFSKNSSMHLLIYVMGLIHYTGAVLAIVGEAPICSKSLIQKEQFSVLDLDFIDILGTALFYCGSLHQHKSMTILANLRKDEKGVVVTNSHKLPHGDWFDYVSNPQYLSEILIYCGVGLILWNNSTWFSVVIWTIFNQVEASLLSHWWYQETFPDLPKQRKVLIPFIF